MPAVGLPDRGHDGSWLARLDDGHDLIGLGTSEVASHEVIASAWGIFLNGYTPFLGAVLNPVVVLRSDVTQHLSTDGINLVRGPEQAYRPLFLLKGLDRRVEQDTIEATIHKTGVILMVFVEGVHGILQRGKIRGAYSTERLSVLRGPEFRLPYPSGISRAKPLPSWHMFTPPMLWSGTIFSNECLLTYLFLYRYRRQRNSPQGENGKDAEKRVKDRRHRGRHATSRLIVTVIT